WLKTPAAWLRPGKTKGLARATQGRRLRRVSEFFRAAVDHELISRNPFAKVAKPAQVNKSRFRMITREMTDKLLEACPSAEWRLIVSLARYGGLRCTSELFALTWDCIDWDRQRIRVPQPKLEHLEGNESREIPLFPELKGPLEECFDAAEPGTV